MKASFLDYSKTILKKVSFDPWLLVKEYHKACKLLSNGEKAELDAWLSHQKRQDLFFPVLLNHLKNPR